MQSEILLIISINLLVLLIVGIFGFWFFNRKSKKRIRPEVAEILSALDDAAVYGNGFLAVKRIDPMSVYVRSPYNRGDQKKGGEY